MLCDWEKIDSENKGKIKKREKIKWCEKQIMWRWNKEEWAK
jgi:hypothetical protein